MNPVKKANYNQTNPTKIYNPVQNGPQAQQNDIFSVANHLQTPMFQQNNVDQYYDMNAVKNSQNLNVNDQNKGFAQQPTNYHGQQNYPIADNNQNQGFAQPPFVYHGYQNPSAHGNHMNTGELCFTF